MSSTKKSRSASAEIKKLRASGALFFVQPDELDPLHRQAILEAQKEELNSPDVSRKIANLQKAIARKNAIEFEFLTTIREEFKKIRRSLRENEEREKEARRQERQAAKLEKEREEFEKLSPLEQKRCLRLKKKLVKKSVRKVKLRRS